MFPQNCRKNWLLWKQDLVKYFNVKKMFSFLENVFLYARFVCAIPSFLTYYPCCGTIILYIQTIVKLQI